MGFVLHTLKATIERGGPHPGTKKSVPTRFGSGGNVYEAYLTHRIHDRFLVKRSYINYDYTWSGSGWQVGAPKRLNSTPILGFPTCDTAKVLTLGIVAEF
jgi:hypothetical protein